MKSGLSGASGFVTVTWGEEALEKAGVQLLPTFLESKNKQFIASAAKKPRKRVGGKKVVVRDVRPEISSLRFEKRFSDPEGGVSDGGNQRKPASRRALFYEYELLRRKFGG